MPTNEPGSGLYLVLEPGEGAPERLAAALAAAPAAAVLLRLRPGTPPDIDGLRALIGIAQARGAAALIEGDARLARTLRADGVHLPASADIEKQYAEARDILGQRYIVGIDAGSSRHAAMALGEAGADYVGFSASEAAPDGMDALEMIQWWAEIFEIPSVALGVSTADQAALARDAGADFIGLHLRNAHSPADAADLARAAVELDAVGGRE